MFSSWLVLFTSSPLQAQRSELNAKVRMLRGELQHLQEQCSYVGEVVKPMDKKKVLMMVHPEGKLVVVFDKNIDMNDVTPNCRVALRNDSYTLHKILAGLLDAHAHVPAAAEPALAAAQWLVAYLLGRVERLRAAQGEAWWQVAVANPNAHPHPHPKRGVVAGHPLPHP